MTLFYSYPSSANIQIKLNQNLCIPLTPAGCTSVQIHSRKNWGGGGVRIDLYVPDYIYFHAKFMKIIKIFQYLIDLIL